MGDKSPPSYEISAAHKDIKVQVEDVEHLRAMLTSSCDPPKYTEKATIPLPPPEIIGRSAAQKKIILSRNKFLLLILSTILLILSLLLLIFSHVSWSHDHGHASDYRNPSNDVALMIDEAQNEFNRLEKELNSRHRPGTPFSKDEMTIGDLIKQHRQAVDKMINGDGGWGFSANLPKPKNGDGFAFVVRVNGNVVDASEGMDKEHAQKMFNEFEKHFRQMDEEMNRMMGVVDQDMADFINRSRQTTSRFHFSI